MDNKMKEYTTKTREFGQVTFCAPSATDTRAGYVYLECDTGYRAGERRQICHGGFFLGDTISATQFDIKEAAQSWIRQRRAWHRRQGI
jgi:hypothetical protein